MLVLIINLIRNSSDHSMGYCFETIIIIIININKIFASNIISYQELYDYQYRDTDIHPFFI
jgi:hypothetical protein